MPLKEDDIRSIPDNAMDENQLISINVLDNGGIEVHAAIADLGEDYYAGRVLGLAGKVILEGLIQATGTSRGLAEQGMAAICQGFNDEMLD